MNKSKKKGKKKIEKYTIDTLQLMRKADREIALETPHIRGGAHKTHKKDKIRQNTVKKEEIEDV